MKRVHFQALLDDAQREHSRLKDELVDVRKKLSGNW
jgi:N6-adenosine-specific RNA methylase IME4